MRNGMNSRRRGLYRFFIVLYAQKEEKMPKNIILIYKMIYPKKIRKVKCGLKFKIHKIIIQNAHYA